MLIILTAIVLALLVARLSRAYINRWEEKLSVDVRFSGEGIYECERGEVVATVANNKLLPLMWGHLQFFTSNMIAFDGEEIDHDYYKRDSVSVLSYEEVVKRLPFTAKKRGYYSFKEAEYITGDLFFNFKFIKKFKIESELYVYPRVKCMEQFNIVFNKVVGDVIAPRNIIEDPFNFRGIRDYYPFDSMRTVNWNATAKTGAIKVNQYHSTSSQEVKLLLDLDGYNRWDRDEIKEDVIRAGAYLAALLLSNGIATGLISNAENTAVGGAINIAAKNGRNQRLQLLREMAKMNTEQLSCPFSDILEELLRKGDMRPHYILVSFCADNDIIRLVNRFYAAGFSLQWIFLKEKGRKYEHVPSDGAYICEVEY